MQFVIILVNLEVVITLHFVKTMMIGINLMIHM